MDANLKELQKHEDRQETVMKIFDTMIEVLKQSIDPNEDEDIQIEQFNKIVIEYGFDYSFEDFKADELW